MRKNPFRRIRAIDDRTLLQTLGGQHNALLGMSAALSVLWKERRLLLVLHVVEAAAIVWLVLR